MPESRVKIAPSILSADFARLGEHVVEVTKAGADYIHVDVMDGQFVPPITIGSVVVGAIRPCTDIPLDVHLMIESPERQLEQFARAGADIITVHAEVCPDLRQEVRAIKALGVKAGVSVNPATPIDIIDYILPELDLVLVMSVNPGYAGQKFMEDVVDKISLVREILDERGLAARGVLVRHLVLPADLADSAAVVDIVAETAPGAAMNVMGQYRPAYRAGQFAELLAVPKGERVAALRRLAGARGLAPVC